MSSKLMNVLFLCTGNSARSILAEALLQRHGAGRFNAYSAGSMPRGRVNPFALAVLADNNFNTENFRSKSWAEFSGSEAPSMDFVFSVCDNAANEACPIWPGQPVSAHWGLPDPDRAELNNEQQQALFAKTYSDLDKRIRAFVLLPFASLDSQCLQKELDAIGKL